MARRPKGDKVDGWLILDKPAGLTSTDCVTRAKRFFNAQKAGHAGTLDPLATGILAIAFGEAYLDLYPHRDEDEAEAGVRLFLERTGLKKGRVGLARSHQAEVAAKGLTQR